MKIQWGLSYKTKRGQEFKKGFGSYMKEDGKAYLSTGQGDITGVY